MHFNLNIIPATIKALTNFVQVLDKHPRGAGLLIVVMTVTGVLMAVPYLPVILA